MKTLSYILIVAVVVVGGYFLLHNSSGSAVSVSPTATPMPTASVGPTVTGAQMTPTRLPATSIKPSVSPTPGLLMHESAIFKVAIANFAFGPATVTVTRGDVVVFSNNDQTPHSVTSDTGAFGADVNPAGQYTLATANLAPGTYTYHCRFHSSMTGTIIVK